MEDAFPSPVSLTLQVSWHRKTVTGSYFLHNHELQNVTSAKYLGVKISSDLRWDSHIAEVTSRVNRTLGFVRQNLHICSCKATASAYKALVRPLLEYASPVWDPYTASCIDSIENVKACSKMGHAGLQADS